MNLQSVFLPFDTAGYQIMTMLLSVLWQSTILFAFAGILAFFLRRKKETVRHAVWLAALLALPLLPILSRGVAELGTPNANLDMIPTYSEPEKAPVSPVQTVPSSPTAESRQVIAPDEPPAPPTTVAENPSTVIAAPVIQERSLSISEYPWALALLAYLLATAGFLGWILVMRFRIHFWIRKGAAVDTPRIMAAFHAAEQSLELVREYLIIEHSGIPAPLTCRVLRPVVILPYGFAKGLADDELRAVALHELAHIRRWDTLVFTLAALVRAFFFFQPLAWFAARQVSYLAEVACDSAALEHGKNPVIYARLLTRLAFRLPDRAPSAELAAGILFTNSSFFRRVREILSDRNSRLGKLSRRALAGVAALGVVSVLLAAAFPLAEKNSGDTVTVSGVVRSQGKPVDGAEIYLSDPKSQKVEKRATSDRQGQFSFRADRSELSGEEWRQPAVVAYKPGLPLGWMEFTRGVDPGAMIIETREGKPITGVVRDSRGNPVPHAEVVVNDIGYYEYGVSNCLNFVGREFPSLIVVTTSDGSFTLPGVPADASAHLIAKADGFGLDYKVYGRGSNPGPVIFSLPTESRISGRVTFGETGKPASNIRIRAFNETIYSIGREAVTDREGRYTVENLPSGVYIMQLFPRDESDAWTAASRKDVTVKAGETAGVDFTLVKGGEITGKVLDRDTGEPISGHWVALRDTILPDRFSSSRYAITDREGNFRFRAVIGTARVFSRAPLGREYSEPVKRETTVMGDTAVSVEPLRFGKGITLHGMVRTLDGKPQAGVHIYGKGASTSWSVSDREGKFTISGLKKGERISLRALHDDRRLRGSVALEAKPDIGVDILLREFETTSRAGRIIDNAGKPVPGAKVQLIWEIMDEGSGYTRDTVFTNNSGRYAFSGLIVGDTYDFDVDAAGYSSPGMIRGDEFVAKPGMPPYRDIVLMKADRWIEVHIEGPDGKPVHGAWVQCGYTNQSVKLTDVNGDVRYEDLAETMVNEIFVSHDDFGRFEFRYAPTNARSTYRLVKAEKYLSGKVVDSSGKPIKNAGISVNPDRFESGLYVNSVETAEDGAFHLSNMAQDTVQVNVYHKDYVYKILDGVRTNQKDMVITLDSKKTAPLATALRPGNAVKDSYPLVPISRRSRIIVDGNLSDWDALPAGKVELLTASDLSNDNAQTRNSPSKDDLSATLRGGADGDYLYLAVDVKDDCCDFGKATFDYLIMQDCVEILFSNGKNIEMPEKLMVTMDSEGNIILGGRDPITYQKYPLFWESVGVSAAIKKNLRGYSVEAAVPWSVLAWSGWTAGHEMGLNVRVYDWDRPRLDPHLVEWSSENGAEYIPLLGGQPKPANVAYRSRDLEKIHAALTLMQKEDWKQAEKMLKKSGNTSWSKSLLVPVLFKMENYTEGAEVRNRLLHENKSALFREWNLDILMNTAYSLEKKGKYREAVDIMEIVDYSGPKSYLLLRTMLQLARCYCVNGEYAKAQAILNQVVASASDKNIQDIESMVLSARQMLASAERMKTMQ